MIRGSALVTKKGFSSGGQLSAQDLWQVAPNSPRAKSVEGHRAAAEVGG